MASNQTARLKHNRPLDGRQIVAFCRFCCVAFTISSYRITNDKRFREISLALAISSSNAIKQKRIAFDTFNILVSQNLLMLQCA